MSGRFAQRVAFVTGAGSGIGREAAVLLAHEGARVVAADLNGDAAGLTAEAHPSIAAVSLDVTSGASAKHAVTETIKIFGALDYLVNAAGVTIPGAVHELTDDQWEQSFSVNVGGIFRVARAAWPHLKASHGVIVNLASILALAPFKADAAYCSSKAAVLMLTKCLALDGAEHGIRANCICPGPTDTPMTRGFLAAQADPDAALRMMVAQQPLGRLAIPSDIADAILFLLSSSARWISGESLVVDGGFLNAAAALGPTPDADAEMAGTREQ